MRNKELQIRISDLEHELMYSPMGVEEFKRKLQEMFTLTKYLLHPPSYYLTNKIESLTA